MSYEISVEEDIAMLLCDIHDCTLYVFKWIKGRIAGYSQLKDK